MDLFHDSCFLTYLLSNQVPQEWGVARSEQTTCHGRISFVRIDVYPRQDKPTCLIEVKDHEIIIFSAHILSTQVQKVANIIRIAMNNRIIPDRCLTLTECPMTCETCRQAIDWYQEPFRFYEEILITP